MTLSPLSGSARDKKCKKNLNGVLSGLLMDKRGISLTLIVFELAIVTLVFYMLGGLVQKTSASEYFSNAVLAEDSALFIDTLYAAPGNARIIYHNDLAGKPVSFS